MKSHCPAKYLLSLIFLFGLLIAATPPPEKLTYTHPTLKYTVTYPADWEVKDMDRYIGFLSPAEDENDKVRENVNIIFEDHSAKPTTLAKLVATSKESVKAVLGSDGTLEEKSLTLLGVPAVQFNETMEVQGMAVRITQYFVIKNNMAVCFTYTTEKSKYDKYAGTVMDIITSFKFPK